MLNSCKNNPAQYSLIIESTEKNLQVNLYTILLSCEWKLDLDITTQKLI